jgi:hypothetical protein
MLDNWSLNFYIHLAGRRTSLLFLGSPQSREVDDRRKEKLVARGDELRCSKTLRRE